MAVHGRPRGTTIGDWLAKHPEYTLADISLSGYLIKK